jgi:hypothetical protein
MAMFQVHVTRGCELMGMLHMLPNMKKGNS